jgi:predicted alpha/beta superfamily hydrolase
MKTEIIPFVDKNYKTNSDRGIFGHSFGGLFTAYCLVNSDGYFTRFGVSSPALWWDNEKLLNQAVTQFKENKTWDIPQTKIFISVGGKEHSGFVPTMVKYSSYLEQSDYYNIDLKWQIFEGESHNSMYSRIAQINYNPDEKSNRGGVLKHSMYSSFGLPISSYKVAINRFFFTYF